MACLPDVGEHFAEGLRLLWRNDEVARVSAQNLLAREARRPLTGVVEEQDASIAVEDADERLRRLGENLGELVAEHEPLCLRLSHGRRVRSERRRR
jgi:hypothetical protein